MLANGWCCHQVNQLSRLHGLEDFSFLAALKRSAYRSEDHRRCKQEAACIAYNTERSTYKTRHVDQNCGCQSVSLSYDSLTTIIRKGGIPLISIQGNSDAGTTPKLQVSRRSRASKYIAISHLWADGLGNPNENSLPLCQIKLLKGNLMALQSVFGESKDPPLFWMDTLCIPVGQDEWALRLTQIDKVASIYKGAISSLVLDAELMALEPNLARLACSAWMSRSWTLQEGQLPPTIAVQFRDIAIVLGRTSEDDGAYQERQTAKMTALLLSDSGVGSNEACVSAAQSDKQEGSTWSRSDLCDPEQNAVGTLPECECVSIALERRFYSSFFAGNTDFISAWNELAGRSTTMRTDIPLVMTNIMDMDNFGLLRYHEVGDMFQSIILSLPRVPLSLFFNNGQRQDQDGNHQNRWIPVQVGPDLLRPDEFLTITSSHLRYKDLARHHDKEAVSIYTVKAVLPTKSKMFLRSENEDIVYLVNPSESGHDTFDTTGFSSTCVMVERDGLLEESSMIRGACFYIRNDPPEPRRGLQFLRSRAERILPPEVDMTFICPMKLQQVADSEHSTLNRTPIYNLDPVKRPCNLGIRYDPLPGFVVLKGRDVEIIPKNVIVGVVFLGGMGISLGFMFGIVWVGCPPMVAYFVACIVACIIGGTADFYLVPKLRKLGAWRHVRSLEAIAARRHPQGAV